MKTYSDCKKFEGIIHTLWAKINRDGLEEKKKWFGERETPTVIIHTTSERVWLCWWWELGCCFYLSAVFHATMPLLLYSFWFPFYFGFIMCSWLRALSTVWTAIVSISHLDVLFLLSLYPSCSLLVVRVEIYLWLFSFEPLFSRLSIQFQRYFGSFHLLQFTTV